MAAKTADVHERAYNISRQKRPARIRRPARPCVLLFIFAVRHGYTLRATVVQTRTKQPYMTGMRRTYEYCCMKKRKKLICNNKYGIVSCIFYVVFENRDVF